MLGSIQYFLRGGLIQKGSLTNLLVQKAGLERAAKKRTYINGCGAGNCYTKQPRYVLLQKLRSQQQLPKSCKSRRSAFDRLCDLVNL